MKYLIIFFSLLVTSDLIVADMENLGCDPGWYDNNGYCYLFNNKKLVTRKQANTECSNQNAFLVRIESSDELTFVTQTLANMPSDGFWTDMSDLRFDGTGTGTGHWMWGQYEPIDNTTIKWNKYPTSNKLESCAAVNIQGKFVNDKCSRKMGYMCEIPQSPSTGCPFGWLISNNACFFFSDTSDPTQLLTWSQAKDACASKPLPTGITTPAKLLTVDDPSDSSYITNNLPEVAKTTATFWTGLTRQGNGWDWFNGDQYDPTFFQWAVEPDNIDNKEHCATILQSGLFSDQDCTKQYNYICRKDEETQNTDFFLGCDGWTRAGHKCYVFYDAPKTTWQDANNRCQKIGGSMLKIENLDEKSWLEWQMTTTDYRAYWTGMNDQQTEMLFRWADGTLANQSLINWDQEPNSWKGNEDCAVILNSGNYDDRKCEEQAPYICEANGQGITCPAGWIMRTNGDCYYFSMPNDTYSWSEASDLCHKKYAIKSGVPTTLLAVNDANEMAWVNSQLAKSKFSANGYWTSLNDRNNEGVWIYHDLFNDQHYDPKVIVWAGEPSDKTGNQDCTYVSDAGRYFDTQCNNKNGFICEKYALGQGAGNSVKAGFVLIFTMFIYTKIML